MIAAFIVILAICRMTHQMELCIKLELLSVQRHACLIWGIFFKNILVAGLKLVVQGIVFSPVPFQSDLLLAHSEQESEQGYSENVPRKGLNGMLRLILNDSFKRVFLSKDVSWLSAESCVLS